MTPTMQVVVALASQSHKSLSYRGLKRHFGDAAGVTKRCAASLFRQGGRDPVRARVRKRGSPQLAAHAFLCAQTKSGWHIPHTHFPLHPEDALFLPLRYSFLCSQTMPVWESMPSDEACVGQQLTLPSPSDTISSALRRSPCGRGPLTAPAPTGPSSRSRALGWPSSGRAPTPSQCGWRARTTCCHDHRGDAG